MLTLEPIVLKSWNLAWTTLFMCTLYKYIFSIKFFIQIADVSTFQEKIDIFDLFLVQLL